MSNRIRAFRLKIDQMGGSGEYYHIAYLDEKVAKAEAERMREEWKSFKSEDVWMRQISDGEAAVGRELYAINKQTWDEYAKQQALKKLTLEERKALGL